jgi:hypothetical protein
MVLDIRLFGGRQSWVPSFYLPKGKSKWIKDLNVEIIVVKLIRENIE